ncbi:MAG: amidinotransferase [Dysgonamonadaceae bacterium]|jgi:hypothetical protein|nr:amidinotransferase [Dysgonamonadaceae bacterium]
MKQNVSTILMIEPVAFGFNAETAGNNYFQQNDATAAAEIHKAAAAEFTAMRKTLEDNGVKVIVIRDTLQPHTPDSIFPNNWVSFHYDGLTILYPMFAPNRRAERRTDILKAIENQSYLLGNKVDLSAFEADGKFLEGTGSMILDRVNRKAYACLSERTDRDVLDVCCKILNFKPVTFNALQTFEGKRLPIYHTNVMMSVGDRFAVVCLQSIDDAAEREKVIAELETDGKEIIEISETQMHRFAGNMLQIENRTGEKRIVLSQTAYESLETFQIEHLKQYGKLLPVAIPVIEKYGGGSVRCMMAEVFLPPK